MLDVILVGSGGYALEIEDQFLDCLEASKGLFDGSGVPLDLSRGARIVGLLDNGTGRHSEFQTAPPRLGDPETHEPGEALYLIAIGDPTARSKYAQLLRGKGATFLTLVDHRAKVARTARLGEGVIVGAHGVVGPYARIGAHAAINVQCSIGHDAVVGAYTVVCPQCALGGQSSVGEAGFIGTGAKLNPGKKIGNFCKVMAGSVVYTNQPDNALVLGNPAKSR